MQWSVLSRFKIRNWKIVLAFALCILTVSELMSLNVAHATVSTFTTSGTWTAPAGVASVTVEVWGGGGAGGGARNTAGSGGGGGGYAKKVVTVVPGNNYTYTVGTGGTGVSNATGNAGNPSWFSTTGTVFAAGGAGGANAAGTAGVGGGTGGAGGTNIGSTTKTGGSGGVGTNATRSGGGGGGAGDTNNGNAGGSGVSGGAGGIGGTTGGGNGGAGINVSGGAVNVGATLGGGGGGAYSTSNGTQPAGAAGARGQVKLTYFADTTAPTPNPMTFATAPNNPAIAGTTTISMVASTATDASSTPVSYYFDATTTSSCGSNGGTGVTDSGWQSGTSYSDTGLQSNKCYAYMVAARDSVLNKTASSSVVVTYTSALKPGAPVLSGATASTLTLSNTENGNPSSNPTTNFVIRIASSTPNDSNWVGKYVNGSGVSSASPVWLSDASLDGLVVTSLHATTTYAFESVARNQDGDRSATSTQGTGFTQDVTAPTPNPPHFSSVPSNDSTSQISMTSGTETDASGGVNYKFTSTTSVNAANWTIPSAGSNALWHGVTYGNNLFVAVGYGVGSRNPAMTSPDGVTWTSYVATGVNDGWNAVTYGGGVFVAVGDASAGANPTMSSSNGSTWTAHAAAGSNDTWTGVAYGNGLFVAIGTGASGDHVMTSPDGINWTARSAAGNDDGWRSVAYGNGLFVAVSNSGDRVMTSPDGITWTPRSAAGNDDTWFGVTYGNGLFVAIGTGASGDHVMTSPNGITWTPRSAAGDNDTWIGVAYGNGLFVAVGDASFGADPVMTSPDGINWTARSAAGNNDSWASVTFGKTRFVSIATVTDQVITAVSFCGGDAGTGATNSGWQSGASYSDSGLQANKCYAYAVTARDSVGNRTATSTASTTYTSAATPGTPSAGSGTGSTLTLTNNANGNPSGTEFAIRIASSTPNDTDWVGKYVNAIGSTSSSPIWQTDSSLDNLVVSGLNESTSYSFEAVARNQDGDRTATSSQGIGTTLDATAPTPNPMTFASAPSNSSASQIDMTATTASDVSTPITYLFSLVAGSCGANAGTGGDTSSWQSGTSYSDTGLQVNKCYAYAVATRDSVANTTASSSVTSVYTSAATPGMLSYSTRTTSTFTLLNAENGNPSSNPATQFAVHVNTSIDAAWSGKFVDASGNASTTAVWLTDAQIDGLVMSGLQTNTSYTMEVKARNQDTDETSYGSQAVLTTDSLPVGFGRGILRLFGDLLGGVRFGAN